MYSKTLIGMFFLFFSLGCHGTRPISASAMWLAMSACGAQGTMRTCPSSPSRRIRSSASARSLASFNPTRSSSTSGISFASRRIPSSMWNRPRSRLIVPW